MAMLTATVAARQGNAASPMPSPPWAGADAAQGLANPGRATVPACAGRAASWRGQSRDGAAASRQVDSRPRQTAPRPCRPERHRLSPGMDAEVLRPDRSPGYRPVLAVPAAGTAVRAGRLL